MHVPGSGIPSVVVDRDMPGPPPVKDDFCRPLMNCGREFCIFFLLELNRKVSKEVVRTRAEQSYHLSYIFALQTWKESVGTTGPNCIILSCQMLFAVHAFPLEGRLANIHVRQGLL